MLVAFTRREEILADLFILDDASPLGIVLPSELVDLFRNRRICVLDAEDLARELSYLIKDFKDPLLVGGGGILTYTFLTRFGYKEDAKIIEVSRKYLYEEVDKTPRIIFEINGNQEGRTNCIDDIIASGATISQLGQNLRCITLLLSSQARGKYRKKEGSTVINVDELFTAQRVNCDKGFPAIFSSRFLIKQIRDNPDYLRYVSKYTDPNTLLTIVKELDKKPFDMLYEDPNKFIKTYGG